MDNSTVSKGARDLAAYFASPASHRDRDHVSRDELVAAHGHVSAEAESLIDVVQNTPDGYDILRGAVREGWFNDSQLSLRDLSALAVPDPKSGKAVTQFTSTAARLQDARAAAEARRIAFENGVSDIATNGRDLYTNRTFTVTLKMKRNDYQFDDLGDALMKHLENEAKAQYQDVTVDGRTYQQWREGQTLSFKMDWLNSILSDDSVNSYAVSVYAKKEADQFMWRDAHGNVHNADKATYDEAVKRMRAASKLTTVDTPDFQASYVLDTPLTAGDVAATTPLTRRFVTLEIANHSFSLDLMDHARDWTTQHRIELEIPPDSNGRGDNFDTGVNLGGALLGNRLTTLSGRVISERTQVDPSLMQVTLKNGRRLIMSRDDAHQRGLT